MANRWIKQFWLTSGILSEDDSPKFIDRSKIMNHIDLRGAMVAIVVTGALLLTGLTALADDSHRANQVTSGKHLASHLEFAQSSFTKQIKWTDIGGGISFYDYFAADDFDVVLQLGEFRNTNDYAVTAPSLQFSLLDKDGNIVTSTNISALYPIIEARKTTPFQIVVDDVHLGDWTMETFETFNVDDSATVCSANLQVKNVKETASGSDSLRIEGIILNGGDAPVDNISINVAVYRTDGRYAGEISDYVQVSVPAGKSAKFNAFGIRSSYPGVDVDPRSSKFTYRIFVRYLPGGFGTFLC